MQGKLIVGERWKLSEPKAEDAKEFPRWNAKRALKLGAFKYGAAGDFLRGKGIAWEYSCNLNPPTFEDPWDDALAASVAHELIHSKLADWKVAYLCGAKVANAFGVRKWTWFEKCKLATGQEAIILPHPSASNAIWRKFSDESSKA